MKSRDVGSSFKRPCIFFFLSLQEKSEREENLKYWGVKFNSHTKCFVAMAMASTKKVTTDNTDINLLASLQQQNLLNQNCKTINLAFILQSILISPITPK